MYSHKPSIFTSLFDWSCSGKVLILFSSLLVGCAGLSEVTPLDVRTRASDLVATKLDTPALTQVLQSFNIPHQADSPWSLDQLTVVAWELRPEVTSAAAEIKASLAAKQLADERPNPVLSLTPEYLINAASGTVPWVVALAADFLTRTENKRSLVNLGADQDISARLAGSEQIFWNIRAEVSQAVVSVITAEAANTMANETLSLRKVYRDWIQRKFATGSLARTDLLQSESELMAAQSQTLQTAGDLIMARSQLASALGAPIEAISGIIFLPLTPDSPPAPASLDQRALREMALINRTDIRQALAEYGRADVDFRSKVAGRYPDLTLSPGTTYDSGNQKISLGVSAEIPLFHDQSAAITYAETQRAIASSHFDTVQTQALTAIDTALATYQSGWDNWQQAETVAVIQQQLLLQAKHRLDIGATDRGDLMVHQLTAQQSQATTISARRILLNAALMLEDAVQRPIWPDTQLTIPTQKDDL